MAWAVATEVAQRLQCRVGIGTHGLVIIGDLEVAVSAATLGVHNTFRDALAIEVRQLVDEGEVLQEDGTLRAGGHRVLVVVDRVGRRSSQPLPAFSRLEKNGKNVESACFLHLKLR